MKKILPIKGYEELYMVSDDGDVFRKNKYCLYKLEPIIDKDGYFKVCLCKENKKKNCFVHRLVAETFIKKKNVLYSVINHKDENKQNNNVSNLEWCTVAYNTAYNDGYIRRLKNRMKPIIVIDDEKTILFESIAEASRTLQINHSNIVQCLKGRRKSVGGFQFQYYKNANGDSNENSVTN